MGEDRVKVRVVQGPMAGSEFTFGEHDTLIVGRDPKCPINLPKDPCVSRHHLILEVCPPEVRLRDLGSRN
ncbi:MAG: FHA domain-containing protein [Candidatus Hydrogenedentes bacterium]|nr:FHA domain-containing protein [Candidatus Hydrogenedentota bacterium]